jgi:predicted ArsR family transcriptional regulator
MIAREAETGALDASFSSTKKRLLLLMKREGPTSLEDLASAVRVSKMAALKHMNAFEAKGLVQRSFRSGGRGRPRVIFSLTSKASPLFPEAYVQMTEAALGFVEKKLGREAVEELLKQRTQELYVKHRGTMEGKDLRGRVEELVRIRDAGGYMADLGTARKDTFEMLEHNCPIYAVAQKYGEACAVEQDLFRKLLKADVDASHRVVAGDPVCRFLIRKRPGERSRERT